jgi:hypothetical protein
MRAKQSSVSLNAAVPALSDGFPATVARTARFTCLTPGLVRLEYSPAGRFEDRRSIRAMTRPEGIPFDRVEEIDGEVRLHTARQTIVYRPDGRPFHAGNLRALDPVTGHEFWNPATVDDRNLGGVHVSMDWVTVGLIPEGVHPATMGYHHIGMDQNLWCLQGLLGDGAVYAVGDGSKLPRKPADEILATWPLERLPPAAQALVRERRRFPPGILSRAGFYCYNDTPSPVLDPAGGWITERTVEPDACDLYLFRYGRDFKQALADYRLLCGSTPMIPRYALGLWYSRFPTLRQDEVRELVDTFAQHDLPLDAFVFDLEWHRHGWHGFDWNADHFSDPDSLLAFLREQRIHTGLNVHPEAVPTADTRYPAFLAAAGLPPPATERIADGMFRDFDVAQRRQAEAFLEVLHRPVQDQGVDFWWIDGHCPIRSITGLESQLWTNHIYQEHARRTYPDRRPMVSSRTAGVGAHRYPYHFTGDAWSYWETLRNQVEQTLRAGHLGQSFITHDVGGHLSTAMHIDPELYMRWVQFAVLSPMVRLHSKKFGEDIGGERRPWCYGWEVLKSFKAAMRFRMRLLPYLYSLVRESHMTGVPICRSNGLERPEWEEGYDIWDAYFLGDRIYAAPMTGPRTLRSVILPPGAWYHGLTGERLESDGRTPRMQVAHFDVAPLHYHQAGSVLITQPYARRAQAIPEDLEVTVYALGTKSIYGCTLYEDDGLTQAHQKGQRREQRFQVEESTDGIYLKIEAAVGDFAGAPRSRHFTIRLVGRHASDVQVGAVVMPLDARGCVRLVVPVQEERACRFIDGTGTSGGTPHM